MGFKEAIQEYGKEITASFACGGVTYNDNDIISMNPHYEGSLLRTVMKCLDIEVKGAFSDSNTDITAVKFGVKAPADTSYSYKEYGTYIIKDKKHDEEQGTTLLECYDQMIKAMVPYDLILEYPEEITEATPAITVKHLLDAICERFGWAKKYTTFVNSDKVIEEEKYDNNYTFRDVLDEIAQAAAGMIAFVGDQLDVIYPTDSGETIDGSNLKTLKMGESYGPVNSVVLARSPQEDNIYRQNSSSVDTYGLTEIRIENNQIMDSHREDFIDGILSKLLGLKFELYELESFGIGYLNLGDFFTIKTPDGVSHKALMLCDDLKITQGLTETSRMEAPEVTETDYSAASETDKLLNKTILKVDKQAQEIMALISRTSNVEGDIGGLAKQVTDMAEVKMDAESVRIEISTAVTDAVNGIDSITTSTGYTFNQDGLHINKSGEPMENVLDNTGMYVNRGDDNILTANNEGVVALNLKSKQFLIVGNNSRFENYGSKRTACFFIGGS